MTRLFVLLGVLVTITSCSLQRSPIFDQVTDAGGMDAPLPPGVDGGGPPDVPPAMPDVPDAPSTCAPECNPGQFCLGAVCYCDAAMCATTGGECAGADCRQCGRVGDACCATREPCLPGGVCGSSGRCEMDVAPCGGEGQACCDGVTCSALECVGGRCAPSPVGCGREGEACCPGEACVAGTSCQWGLDLRQLCRPCGGRGEGCCPFGERCEGGRSCGGFSNLCI